MHLLLDTHTFLWFIAGSDRISPYARDTIADGSHNAHLSIASLWEIAIKVALGKLSISAPFEQLIPYQLQYNNVKILRIELNHLNRLMTLPQHHRDPFDRLREHITVAKALLINIWKSCCPLGPPFWGKNRDKLLQRFGGKRTEYLSHTLMLSPPKVGGWGGQTFGALSTFFDYSQKRDAPIG